jgi:hypothetical protein
MAWTATTDDFADAVRECAALPSAGTPTDAEIFRVADREIQTRFVPFMRDLRENFWVTTTTQALTVGTADYRIPSDAQGGTLRMVMVVDSAGVERNLQQVPIQYDARWNQNGRPVAFCIIDDKVRLFPAPDTAETLRMLYYRRPSKLVPLSECAEIISATDTVAKIAYEGYVATQTDTGDPFDIVQAQPHFSVLVDGDEPTIIAATYSIDILFSGGTSVNIDSGSGWSPAVGDAISQGSTTDYVSSVNTPTIFNVTPGFQLVAGAATAYVPTATFSGLDLDALGVVAGDYICRHMETCVVQLPAELYYALISATAAQLLNTDGDQAGFMREMAQCERIMVQARSILAPRVDGAPRVIVSANNPLRSGRRRVGRGWDMS